MNKKILKIRDLGLAAFCKMSGCKLVKYENRLFEFESEKSLEHWEVLYGNSCCRVHDGELIYLRRFITKNRNS